MASGVPDEAATYSCNLCPKTFTSWQALGGHQNAHRKERYAIKRMENERKMARAREAHLEQQHWFLLPRPPSYPGLSCPDFNGTTPPVGNYGMHAVGTSTSGGNVGGARQGPVSGSMMQVEGETLELDLTLKL